MWASSGTAISTAAEARAAMGANANATGAVHGMAGGRLLSGTSAKASALAAKASVSAKVLAALGIGVAGLSLAAHSGAAPGLQVALSSVPVWTHAHSVLEVVAQRVHGHLAAGGKLGIGAGL